ncbi:MAG: DUF2029 domain-containing protein [Pseudomonadales bacterium]|nr:DUF2029 domain-containing protein [Pseudomonadales bacterium]
MSQFFAYEIPWLDRPNILIVLLMMSIGVAYLFFVNKLIVCQPYKPITIILIGLVLRIIFLDSTPVYEDDFYRYFWDAELSTQGINPYSSAPIDAMPSPFDLDKLYQVDYLDRVAYPTIRTIYPPLTQTVFAIAHWISPADLTTWRLILLMVDCIAVGILALLLRELGKDTSLIGIYWLNPLLIIETIGAAHMDVLLIPFLTGSALLYIRKQQTYSGVLLACAVGIKLWPILLPPLLFRSFISSPKQLFKTAWPFLVLCVLFLAPQLLTRLDYDAGVVSYALTWNTNAFIYPLINSFFGLILGADRTGIFDPNLVSRLLVIFVVVSVLIHIVKKPESAPEDIVWRMLMVTAVLLMFSPTGYPWYYLWLLPWLSCIPYKPILLLTATLPLYYLRYLFEIKGLLPFFNGIIVMVEFIPSLLLAAYCYLRLKGKPEAIEST